MTWNYGKLSLSAVLVSVSFCLVFLGSTTNALYENNQTDEVHIGGTSGATTCDAQDLTNSWSSPFFDETYTEGQLNYKQSWNYGYGAPYNGDMEAFAQAWRDKRATTDTSGWAVAQYSYDGLHNTDPNFDDSLMGFRLYLFDPATTFTVNEGSITANQNIRYQDYWMNVGPGYCRFQTDNYNSISSTTIGTTNVQWLFFASDNLSYDPGYTGDPLPEGAGSGPDLPDLSPKFTYTVTDKDVSAKDEKQDMPTYTPDEGYFFQGYSIKYYLFKCIDGWNDQINMCVDSTIVNTQTLPIGEQYKYSVTDYDDYVLEAEYLATECYRYAGYPATPDNCYLLQLNDVFPDYEFHSTKVHLVIDGKTFSGNTATEECDVSGYCAPPDDGLGIFRSLDNINTFGLQEFFIAPINFYATLASKVDTCTPITVPFLESSFQMTCMKQNYYNWSPSIMLLYTTIMIATTGYLIAFNIFRTIKNINTPDHDGIEVAKL